MKKRICSLLLAGCMVLGLVTAMGMSARAEELRVGSVNVTVYPKPEIVPGRHTSTDDDGNVSQRILAKYYLQDVAIVLSDGSTLGMDSIRNSWIEVDKNLNSGLVDVSCVLDFAHSSSIASCFPEDGKMPFVVVINGNSIDIPIGVGFISAAGGTVDSLEDNNLQFGYMEQTEDAAKQIVKAWGLEYPFNIDATWTKGSEGLTFTFDNDFSTFANNVFIGDGAPLAPSNYTARAGSTIITLKPEFLATLENGIYPLNVEFNTGIESKTFMIADASAPTPTPTPAPTPSTPPTGGDPVAPAVPVSPKTGESNMLPVITLIMVAGLAGLALTRKRA